MSLEQLIRAWKEDNQDRQNEQMPENPIGQELSNEELERVLGLGKLGKCLETCGKVTCPRTGVGTILTEYQKARARR